MRLLENTAQLAHPSLVMIYMGDFIYISRSHGLVVNMANAAGGNVKGGNQKDLAKLQALQNKSARASNAMKQGGSVGLIRR